MFWRYDDARVWAWVDTDDPEKARERAAADLEARGWQVSNFEFVTVFSPPVGQGRSRVIRAAEAKGSCYRFRRWYVRPIPETQQSMPCPSPMITSRYADVEGVSIDAEQVPEKLRHLIPHAKTWAIGDDVERLAFIESQPIEKKRAFVDAVRPHFEDLRSWSVARQSETPVPDEVVLLDMMSEAAAEVEPDVYPRGTATT